jgi:pyruvate, orthophosphate dikinase
VVEVPEGFVISTQASIEYDGHIHDKLEGRCHRAIKRLEQLTHRKIENLGEGDIPLLLSVRASPTLVTPGSTVPYLTPLTLALRLMDSFLNVGINDEICERLASMPGGNRRFALDTYQRFLQLFGKTVLSLDSEIYDNIIRIVTGGEGVKTEAELSELGLETLVEQFKRVALVPENPMKQFWMVLRRMLDSTHEIRSVNRCCDSSLFVPLQ